MLVRALISSSLLALALSVPMTARAAPKGERVSPAVHQALQAQQSVRVVVAFVHPAPGDRNQQRVRAKIAAQRGAALAQLAVGDFRVAHAFAAVPAMAGYARAAAVAKLSARPDVRHISLDPGGSGGLMESVPLIGADLLAGSGLTGAGTTIAVLDSGIDSDHPDFQGVTLVAQQCFCDQGGGIGCCPNAAVQQSGPGSAEDDHGHGTSTTGIIASAGNVAPRGVAAGVDVVSVKVLDSNNAYASSSQIVAALDWLLVNQPGIDVVNMSLGSNALYPGVCDNEAAWTMALAQAVSALRSSGVTVVTISANQANPAAMAAPGCLSDAFSVGAVYDANIGVLDFSPVCVDSTTATDQITCYSNASPAIDLLAPGSLITLPEIGGGVRSGSGTSFASPMVAGVVAIMRGFDAMLTPAQMESALTATGLPILDTRNGLTVPRLDAAAALSALGATYCGDGQIDGEECDDGAVVSGDGCSATCTVEDGYACSGEPSSCDTVCGDGFVTPDEGCDDGNDVPGDGCSQNCIREPSGTGGMGGGGSASSGGSPPIDDKRVDDDCGCHAVGRRSEGGGVFALLALAWLIRRRVARSGSLER